MRFVALLALLSCTTEHRFASLEPDVVGRVVHREIPLGARRAVDLLFVVDNSPAMAPHRATLVENARLFVGTLMTLYGGMPDLHLGVITTDVGTRGALDNTAPPLAGCTENGDAGVMRGAHLRGGANYFVDSRNDDGLAANNYDGPLADALAATFEMIGNEGCGFPRPLEAVRRAVRNPRNDGFVRPRGQLLIVFLTAQDDCSFVRASFLDGADTYRCVERGDQLVAVDDFVAAVKSLKPDPALVMVAGAFGPPEPFVDHPAQRSVEPSCTTGDRSALPGVRLARFLSRFPNRWSMTTLCQQDLSGVMTQLGGWFPSSVGSPCLEQPLADLDPDTPGDQVDCSAWLRAETGDEQLVDACRAGVLELGLCWSIAAEPLYCPNAPQQIFRLATWHPRDVPMTLVFECVVE